MSETKFTPGPWHAGHMVDDSHPCECRSVVSEHYAGGICEIDVDNGLSIEDGGNDAPPLEEAKANCTLIAEAPAMYGALEPFAREAAIFMPGGSLAHLADDDGASVPIGTLRQAFAALQRARGKTP